ncbi:putative cytochrome P450 [Agrobacterium rubi TR3 = NBRC 13261]|uniref:Putative cytochrome P450 n=1 Tax=Agrobacterium rubi TR3 = NBRC 13261 TaxID=1368415 RepID=A0A081D0V9_9HYPH|nr:cytochrome P450 [Agrobacterium rubi]MBP1881084.1 cytochrome P450 [Agrobacterium rubi]MCL6650726.1 cytochrome P450 [Agrobacterium rubi]GAK72555.1 putative cytochrome P450 [Agrobacterium rubi TR3 = NBRC 13261]
MDTALHDDSKLKTDFPLTPQSTLGALAAIIRNPLDALPPSIFKEPLVFSKTAGELKVYLADPVLIHEALVKNADVLGKGDQVRRALGSALGEGLLTADGANWKWQRQSVAGAFRHDKLLELQPTMIAAAERTRDRWLEKGHGTLDVGHEMMRTTFDIIVETMMSGGHGIDVAKVEKGISDFLEPTGWNFALGLLHAPEWIPYPGRRKARAAVEFLRSSLGSVIEERRKNPDDRLDLVNMLLSASDPETGRTMTNAEIVDNLMTFITAGHETTALGLAWTFDLLARHPQVETKVLAEIDAVTAGRPVLADDVSKLVYTRQVFSEAMRLYPPAPIITRTALQDFQLGEYRIPAGTVLIVPIYAVHRHASLWSDPEVFDPDRFSPEAAKTRHRYAYMPFGAGPRVCIGNAFAVMEAVVILAVMLQKVRLSALQPTAPTPIMKVTLRPNQPLNMKLAPRKCAD